ncbi:MAG: hypothetical protein ACOX4O_06255 [Eubacteriales bacterium]|jgi:hypothetical protein
MKLIKSAEREFTKIEEETIAKFRYYFDEKTQFALIGEKTVVGFSKEGDLDEEKATKLVKKSTRKALSSHPDFSAYTMDDDYGLVILSCGGIFIRSEDILSDEEIESGDVNLGRAVSLKNEALDCCENPEIIAFVLNDQ